MVKKVLWIDTETTGIDPVKNDIIQLSGLVEIDNVIVETFNLKCKPFDINNIDQKSLIVNNITIEELSKYPEPYKAFEGYKKILKKYVDPYDKTDKFDIAGKNVRFDIDFTHEFFKKNNDDYFGSWFNWAPIDLYPLAKIVSYLDILQFENLKLETICKKLDISFKAHDAMEDILATRKATKQLISLLNYSKSKADHFLNYEERETTEEVINDLGLCQEKIKELRDVESEIKNHLLLLLDDEPEKTKTVRVGGNDIVYKKGLKVKKNLNIKNLKKLLKEDIDIGLDLMSGGQGVFKSAQVKMYQDSVGRDDLYSEEELDVLELKQIPLDVLKNLGKI